MNREILRDLLIDNETPATMLHCLVLKEYSSRCYNWEFETLWYEIQDDFRIEFLSDFAKAKISAVITLNTSDRFYVQWEAFEDVGKAFNHQDVHFEDLTPLSPEELTWTILEAKLNDDDENPFTDDVMDYIKTCFKAAGVSTCPKFINKWVRYNTYHKFDENIEQTYQKRIEAYSLMQIDKIIELSRRYFNVDIRKSIVDELPNMEPYIKL